MPQPKGSNGRCPRSHRDDAVLDLRDLEHGLTEAFHWHKQQETAHQQQRRHVAHLYAHVQSALRGLAEAQRIDDDRKAAA